jgi:hypothetical protein
MLKSPQRPLNSSSDHNIARSGAPKRVQEVIPPAAPNMKRQTAPSHEFLHGAPVDDEADKRLKTYETKIPVHPGMTEKQRAALHPIADNPSEILREASNLGPGKA